MFNMSNIVMVDDFPDNFGGAELVNRTVADHLGAKIVSASKFSTIEKDTFYIISNISTMPRFTAHRIAKEANYIILEHDYKFVESRHPWKYEDCLVPEEEKILLDLYKNAKAIFVQTDDHKQVFLANKIEGNFVSLSCSIWSDSELDMLEEYYLANLMKEPTFCVMNSANWIKNTMGAVDWCEHNKLTYALLEANEDPKEFLRDLAKHSCLVFIPVARESCCRLLVEARCLGLNTITTSNSGAWLSDWYNLSGKELIKFLRDRSHVNLKLIRREIHED
tara:strand:- start:4213 stop:5046 length:834 start_codon:yes stop_codon:yes gene_type:complete